MPFCRYEESELTLPPSFQTRMADLIFTAITKHHLSLRHIAYLAPLLQTPIISTGLPKVNINVKIV